MSSARTSLTSLALLVALLAVPPAGAEPRLLSAGVRVEPLSANAALVHAEYTIAGTERIEWLLAWFPGQNVSELRGQVNDRETTLDVRPGAGPAQRRIRALPGSLARAADGAARVTLEYRVSVRRAQAHRIPLPVPLAPPPGHEPSVRVVVVVPEGATPLGSHFPRLRLESGTDGTRRLHADLAAVPAFLHVRLDGLDGTAPPGPGERASANVDPAPGRASSDDSRLAGFGWNFWGFLLVAVAWCVGYFTWALAVNRREAGRG